MNAKELADATGLHENTIRNMIKRGELKAKKCGKYFIIDEEQAKALIFSRRAINDNQDKIASTYELLNIMEIRKKELFKEFMLSIVSCHMFSKKLYDINMDIGRGNISEEEGDHKIDLLTDYYISRFEEGASIQKFKEYESVLNSINEIKKIQDIFLNKKNITVSTAMIDIEI